MISIQRHMTQWLVLAVLGLATLVNLTVYFNVRTALRREFDRRLGSDARALSRLIAYDEKARLELEIPVGELGEFSAGDRPAYFEIWKSDGSLFFRSPSLVARDLPTPNEAGVFYSQLPDGREGRGTLLHFIPHRETDEPPLEGDPPVRQEVEPPSGPVTLLLAYDMNDSQGFLRYLAVELAGGTIALGLICALVVYFAVRRTLRPLNQLGEEAAAFHPRESKRRFHVHPLPRELAPIVARLNDLLERVAAAFNRERRFTANAAHELRTPIAELRTCAEVALRTSSAEIPGAHRGEFEEVLAIARQMGHLTNALLSIARTEHPQSLELQPVALTEVVQAVVARYEAPAAARQLALAFSLSQGGTITTDRTLLEALLHNLLGNAVAYAPPHSTINIEVQTGAPGTTIRIENDAALTNDDLPHLFEPFWRTSAARTSGEHAGLGLAVAEAYAVALGLQLTATLKNQRLCMALVPAPPAADANL